MNKRFSTTTTKLASAARPRNELISVGIQLPPGTLTPKLPLYDLLAAIISTARLSPKDSEEVTLQAKPAQSLVFLRTQSPLTANLLLSLTHLQLQAMRRATQPPPSSSSSIRESASTSAPSPPGSYAAVVKAPSALSHSSSSNTPPLSLTNENRSFDLRLAMLERNQRGFREFPKSVVHTVFEESFVGRAGRKA
ncbi:hypothetical protein HPB50_016640 [Hyalomma asiaticum]|uniref:Uncharacterized protein n=1 Tax=Hyalomma asiaticum TaxID=266040 RepID=A0ACB7SG45_HYAAI|nr:hypothetical protein HPB50_016640 [Hyalomma asiaticum]